MHLYATAAVGSNTQYHCYYIREYNCTKHNTNILYIFRPTGIDTPFLHMYGKNPHAKLDHLTRKIEYILFRCQRRRRRRRWRRRRRQAINSANAKFEGKKKDRNDNMTGPYLAGTVDVLVLLRNTLQWGEMYIIIVCCMETLHWNGLVEYECEWVCAENVSQLASLALSLVAQTNITSFRSNAAAKLNEKYSGHRLAVKLQFHWVRILYGTTHNCFGLSFA